jgi:hypothetical protein
VCLAANGGRQGTGHTTGLVMIIKRDQVDKAARYHGQQDIDPVGDLPPLTPEAARSLAAILAPHLVAMRAVTAGTPYAECGAAADAVPGCRHAPPVSPATQIFIAGMLQRIPA